VFDLDETLIHCKEDFDPNNIDHVIKISFPDGETVTAGLNVRPYALETLKAVQEDFQIVIFTASHQNYADAVLDFIDPDRELTALRLYRENCIETEEGVFIKDLRVLANRDLKDIMLVDNAAYSFGYQIDNGVPIIPFYDDKNDKELMHLIVYLQQILKLDDVRE
jgi:CTD small phosphatase-like protein 2